MENTVSLLIQDTNPQWFATVDDQLVGPISSKDIVEQIRAGGLNFSSFVWKKTLSGWTRLYEIEDFHCLMVAAPKADLLEEAKKRSSSAPAKKAAASPAPAAEAKEEPREWFVYLQETQYGPFAKSEVQVLIQAKRVTPTTYIWKKGFADWQLANTVAEWKDTFAPPARAEKEAAKSSDKRIAPRKPFEAKIILTDGKEVGWAVCRDISVGGMQLLMDHAPGAVGTVLRLNVSSIGDIPSFACEGSIVRVLEDGRGFSFRFANLPTQARQAIEKYISITSE